jgi:ketopantoate reductase
MAGMRVHVVGMGEVGTRLGRALSEAGAEVLPVTRTNGWEGIRHDEGGLVLVCVREEELEALLPRFDGVAPARLVFVQNGWVRPLLQRAAGCSRGLIWFTSKGQFFRVLRSSPFTGPAAARLAEVLASGGIPTTALDEGRFAAAEVEKMGFNCVVGLPLAVHGVSLAEYLKRLREEAREVFREAVGVLGAAAGLAPGRRWWDAFLASAQPLGWVTASRPKAVELRNGAVVRLAEDLGLPAPVNRRLVDLAGR